MPTTPLDSLIASSTATPLPFDALDLSRSEVAERLLQARRMGHPEYLWPDVPVQAWRAALRDIERCVTVVLAGERGRLHRDSVAATRALGIAAFTSGTGPLLGAWIETGTVETDAATAALLELHLRHARVRAERLAAELESGLRILGPATGARGSGRAASGRLRSGADSRPRRAGTVVLLKGAHTSRVYFDEPALRPMADLDLLIDAGRLPAARGTLQSAGYAETLQMRRPYKAEWRRPDAATVPRSLELTHADNPIALELHTSLERRFLGVRRVCIGGAACARPLAEGPAGCAALAQPHLTIYHALHASEALPDLTLIRLIELVNIIRRDVATGMLDWDELVELLRDLDAERFIYPALELAERLAPGTVPVHVRAATGAAATPRLRRIVATLSPGTAQRPERVALAERFMWASSPADHARRALVSLWPLSGELSVRRLRRIYLDRLTRTIRGRVTLTADRSAGTGNAGPPGTSGE